MDKKLTRAVLFSPDKKTAPFIPGAMGTIRQAEPVDKAEKILAWLLSHKKFKWSTMCKEINVDKGNFQRQLKAGKITLGPDILLKIEEILKPYGY